MEVLENHKKLKLSQQVSTFPDSVNSETPRNYLFWKYFYNWIFAAGSTCISL